MPNQLETTYAKLIQLASALPGVQSIGRSGGRALPASAADGDIDVFLYCYEIPSHDARKAILDSVSAELDTAAKVGVFSGGRWGDGDFARIWGVETWLMYFTLEQAAAEVDAVLCGEQPDREGGFYPTGRCAMYLGMEVLLDRGGFLHGMKEQITSYPEALAEKLVRHHLSALDDLEDLERAVARKDPLFYHYALDNALDHFLQALFARNRVFFPSRKRSLEHIAGFAIKPTDCERRILDVIRLGGTAEGIGQSYCIWSGLANDLKVLCH